MLKTLLKKIGLSKKNVDDIDITQPTVINYKEKIIKNHKFVKFYKNFEENDKSLYNIWNTSTSRLLNKITTQVLDFCKLYQKDRGVKNTTFVVFNFTEGWFRNSQLTLSLKIVI